MFYEFLFCVLKIFRMSIRQIWLGEEHLGPYNGAKEAYVKIMEAHPDQNKFKAPLNIGWCAQEEQPLDDEFCEKVCKFIQNNRAYPICYVLCIGSFDIRNFNVEKNRAKILKRFHRIITTAHQTPKAALIVVSPIPDVWGFTDKDGDQLDKDLDLMIKVKQGNSNFTTAGRIHYLKFRTERCPPNELTGVRYNVKLFQDGFHLSDEGVELLVKDLFELQQQIPDHVFTTEREDFYRCTTALLKLYKAKATADQRAEEEEPMEVDS